LQPVGSPLLVLKSIEPRGERILKTMTPLG